MRPAPPHLLPALDRLPCVSLSIHIVHRKRKRGGPAASDAGSSTYVQYSAVLTPERHLAVARPRPWRFWNLAAKHDDADASRRPASRVHGSDALTHSLQVRRRRRWSRSRGREDDCCAPAGLYYGGTVRCRRLKATDRACHCTHACDRERSSVRHASSGLACQLPPLLPPRAQRTYSVGPESER